MIEIVNRAAVVSMQRCFLCDKYFESDFSNTEGVDSEGAPQTRCPHCGALDGDGEVHHRFYRRMSLSEISERAAEIHFARTAYQAINEVP